MIGKSPYYSRYAVCHNYVPPEFRLSFYGLWLKKMGANVI